MNSVEASVKKFQEGLLEELTDLAANHGNVVTDQLKRDMHAVMERRAREANEDVRLYIAKMWGGLTLNLGVASHPIPIEITIEVPKYSQDDNDKGSQ